MTDPLAVTAVLHGQSADRYVLNDGKTYVVVPDDDRGPVCINHECIQQGVAMKKATCSHMAVVLDYIARETPDAQSVRNGRGAA